MEARNKKIIAPRATATSSSVFFFSFSSERGGKGALVANGTSDVQLFHYNSTLRRLSIHTYVRARAPARVSFKRVSMPAVAEIRFITEAD